MKSDRKGFLLSDHLYSLYREIHVKDVHDEGVHSVIWHISFKRASKQYSGFGIEER